MRVFRGSALIGLVLTCMTVAGCGQKIEQPIEKLVPVGGKVTFDGKPQAGIQVIFTPMGQNIESHGGNGVTDANGAFTLKNYMGLDGIPVGQYIATFSWMVGPDGSLPKPGAPPIPGISVVERIPPEFNEVPKSKRKNSVTITEAGKTDLEYKIPAK